MACQGPMEILLVEDNPDDLELSLRSLRKHGPACRIRVARDGRAALGMACDREAGNIGVVLLDLRLPGMDGIEVLGELRSGSATRELPVVMMVSSELDRDFLARRGIRPDGFIVKPVSFEKLSGAVRAAGVRCDLCAPAEAARAAA